MYIPQTWTLLKGLTYIRGRFLMSGSTPLLQKWTPPTLNSGTAGAYSNAPTSALAQGGIGTTNIGAEGIASVSKNAGAGSWTVTLQDQYQRLLYMEVMQSLSGGLSTVGDVGEDTAITSMKPASGGSVIGVQLLSGTATAADPATTTSITLSFWLQNSTAF